MCVCVCLCLCLCVQVNIMQRSFHKMKSGLISFKKFMPEMVVRNLLKAGRTMGLGVERKYLTIFFSNIANFEKVSSEMNDTLVMMEFLSDYFGTMAKAIEETNGTLIEFVGDEILALWNAPVDVVSHEATCVASALQMQVRVMPCVVCNGTRLCCCCKRPSALFDLLALFLHVGDDQGTVRDGVEEEQVAVDRREDGNQLGQRICGQSGRPR
jgi:class 3 adenylate cyclase